MRAAGFYEQMLKAAAVASPADRPFHSRRRRLPAACSWRGRRAAAARGRGCLPQAGRPSCRRSCRCWRSVGRRRRRRRGLPRAGDRDPRIGCRCGRRPSATMHKRTSRPLKCKCSTRAGLAGDACTGRGTLFTHLDGAGKQGGHVARLAEVLGGKLLSRRHLPAKRDAAQQQPCSAALAVRCRVGWVAWASMLLSTSLRYAEACRTLQGGSCTRVWN